MLEKVKETLRQRRPPLPHGRPPIEITEVESMGAPG